MPHMRPVQRRQLCKTAVRSFVLRAVTHSVTAQLIAFRGTYAYNFF
jgi:hypothetical protein